MKFLTKEEFINGQKALSRLFKTAREHSHLSHAYLLYGESSSPLKECANYLAMSLNCEKGELACGECESCERFKKGIHPDFMMIDGSNGAIKKESINELSNFFSLTSSEKDHVSCYVIHLIENSTAEAINALLKFLEEPRGNIFAILTTTNRSMVLPTILSRCESIRVASPNLDELCESYDGDISLDAYYLLSNFIYDEDEKMAVYESKEFQDAYKACFEFLEALVFNSRKASLVLMTEAADKLKGQRSYNYFYRILIIIFTDAIKEHHISCIDKWVMSLKNYKAKLVKALELLNEAYYQRKANMNFTFILAKLALILED